ncbi:MAG: hypothetical protein FJX60_06375 [Alphaproteobacteria bacterium]|nr:hypothetical protein [Alphaproteobacteria bacterium]
MKIAKFDCFPVRVPYRQNEQSSVVNTAGVSAVIVRLETDDGLVGWGEADTAADTASIEAALRSAAPFVVGSDPWCGEQTFDRVLVEGRWRYQAMTASLAFAAIDMAMLDICGKAAGQPVHRLLGGARRETVDYFDYLSWGTPDELAVQCREGVERGYTVFYLKVGKDRAREEAMLEAIRSTIGPARRLRIDANQSWTLPEAERILRDWHRRFDIDFAEAPVPIEPIEQMQTLAARVDTPLCVNEGPWGEAEALRLILARVAPYLCFSPCYVGTMRRFLMLCRTADRLGQVVCKHTWGELGLTAAAGQHAMLAAPADCLGHQQTAQYLADDIVKTPVPIMTGPRWGLIDGIGLGVEVDEDKVRRYHEDYKRLGEYARVRPRA